MCQRKFIIPAFDLPESKIILSQCRYADNALRSFQDREKVDLVSKDLHIAHDKYNFPLKPIMTSVYTDPDIATKLEIEPNHTEPLFGMRWNIQTNTFLPNFYLTFHGKRKGQSLGPPLRRISLQ